MARRKYRPAGTDKATNLSVTPDFLQQRAERSTSKGYAKQKWISFCEALLSDGYRLSIYEARQTFSKYITVHGRGAKPFKVRFSNHRPIAARERAGDCDFFVGVTNLTITTTDQALAAVRSHFAVQTAPAISQQGDSL
jgi:hypothetical protein